MRPYAHALRLLALALITSGSGAAAQSTASYVVDQTGALADADRQSLSDRLAALDDSTAVQIVVVTMDLLGAPIADAALFGLNQMRLGQAGLNNGVLVLLAPADRAVHVSVGTGLEWQIPDSVAAAAVDLMLPYFRDGEYAGGLGVGVDALSKWAASVPWGVRFGSAAEAVAAGPAAVGEVARVRGVYADGALQTEAGPVALAFPPYWSQAHPTPQPGGALDLLARVVGAEPLAVQVLGLAPGR